MPSKPKNSQAQLEIGVVSPLDDGYHLSVFDKPDPASTKGQRREFFLPVTGFVWFYPEEVEVIDHPVLQRLGKIYQLGQTNLVYRGATHKRLEHVLGAVHVVQRMIDAVEHNSRKGMTGVVNLEAYEWRFIRLGALLHDIGHIAAGHTVEDELCLVGKHDADERLDFLFDGAEWQDSEGRTLATIVDAAYDKYLAPGLVGKVRPSELVRLLIRKQPENGIEDSHEKAEKSLLASEFRLKVSRDMIGNGRHADTHE